MKTQSKGITKADVVNGTNGPNVVRSMARAKNLTAKNDLSEIRAVGDRIVVTLKSWPAQSMNGVFMPESYTVIRGNMYVTEVVSIGSDVTLVKAGDVIVVSIYSGFHITTKTGHAKIISESDVLIFKSKKEMDTNKSFNPKTFKPGINNILVEMIERKQVVTASGIISEVGEDDVFNDNDVVTKSAKILAVGPTNDYGKDYKDVGIGSVIIIDSFVGNNLNTSDISDDSKYRVLLSTDILGYIVKK
jgi:co-chaperonin GroES (HSP10)